MRRVHEHNLLKDLTPNIKVHEHNLLPDLAPKEPSLVRPTFVVVMVAAIALFGISFITLNGNNAAKFAYEKLTEQYQNYVGHNSELVVIDNRPIKKSASINEIPYVSPRGEMAYNGIVAAAVTSNYETYGTAMQASTQQIINLMSQPSLTPQEIDRLINYNLANAISTGFIVGNGTQLRGCLQANETGVISGRLTSCSSNRSGGGNGNTSMGVLVSGSTEGSIFFAGNSSTLAQDNGNFFWNDTANALGIGTNTPNASAAVDISSTTKGFLAPRMTTVQRDAITAPAAGLLVYNTTDDEYNVYDGTSWDAIGGGASIGGAVTGGTAGSALFIGAGGVLAQDNANYFWDDTTNRLGIGDATPSYPLDVNGNINSATGYLLNGTDINTAGTLSNVAYLNQANTFSLNNTFSTSVTTPLLTATGALAITPAAGSNLNINLSGAGDFAVNTDQLYVDTSTGRVGIGSSNPADMLEIVGDTTIGVSYTNSTGHALMKVDGENSSQAGYYIHKAGVEIAQIAVLGGSNDLTFSMAGSPMATLTAGGNFGIGDATPAALLTIGSGDLFQVASNGNLTSSNAGTWTFSNDTNIVLPGGVNGLSFDTNTLSIDATNNRVGIGTTAPTAGLSIYGTSGNQLRLHYDDTFYWIMERAASGYLQITDSSAGGIPAITLQNDGDLGLGTAAPNHKLDVNGNVNVGVGNNYYINGVSINTAGTLSNVAYLNQSNTFTAAQTITVAVNPGFTVNSSATTGSGIRLNATGTGGRTYQLVSSANSAGIGGGSFAIADTAVGYRFVIDSAGDVGIGLDMSNPTGELTVKTSTAAADVNILTVLADDDGNLLNLTKDASDNAALALYNGSGTSVISLNGDSASNSYFNAGNVGIGATDPGSFKLFVQPSSNSAASSITSGAFAINAHTGTGARMVMGYDTTLGTYGSGYIRAGYAGCCENPLLLQPGNGIGGGGNVGIGDLAPTAPLSILAYGYTSSATSDFIKLTSGPNNLYGIGILFKSSLVPAIGTGEFNSGRIFSVYDGNTGYSDARITLQSPTGAGTWDDTLNVKNSRVGIGDTSPAALLTVGSGDLFQVASNGNLTSSNAGTWTFSNDTNIVLSGGVNGMSFDTDTLSIDANSNRVGIGTTAPSNTLQIGDLTNAVTSTPLTLSLGGTFSDTAGANIKLKVYDDGVTTYGLGVSNQSLDYTSFNKHSFYSSGALKMQLDGTSGSLNIGGTNTSHKLYVEGSGSASNGYSLGRFDSGSSVTAGNLYGIGIYRQGVEALMMGVNKNSATGTVPAHSTYISSFNAAGTISIGRGNDGGLPNSSDIFIAGSGNVGIGGNVSADTTLEVTGGLCVSDATGDSCITSSGDIRADGAITANAFDIAERYAASEVLAPGTVVMIDPNKSMYVKTHAGSAPSMGIVSTDPGFVLGWENNEVFANAPHVATVALAGRVPVKVTNENGAIVAGDSLTTSATKPGYAMKSTGSGAIIGQALESFNGAEGLITVFIKSSSFNGVALQNDVAQLQAQIANLQGDGQINFSAATPIVLQSHLYLSEDSVGEAKILPGDTSVRINFVKPYLYQPIVTATPNSRVGSEYWIDDKDASGFTIYIEDPSDDVIYFNWHSFAGSAAKLTVSNGTQQEIVLGSSVVNPESTTEPEQIPEQENPEAPEAIVSEPESQPESEPETSPAEDSPQDPITP